MCSGCGQDPKYTVATGSRIDHLVNIGYFTSGGGDYICSYFVLSPTHLVTGKRFRYRVMETIEANEAFSLLEDPMIDEDTLIILKEMRVAAVTSRQDVCCLS
jgi:hypothetical protein